MHILSIDAGSYSVKFISSYIDKRKASHVECGEIIVDDVLRDHPELGLENVHFHIMQELMDEKARPDTKVITHVPLEMVTTRFLTLPVKSRKKADLMVPFQLEEDIPYTLSEAHYAYKVEPQKTQSLALAALIRVGIFNDYFDHLKSRKIIPQYLTSEPSILDSFYVLNKVAGPFCVMDIGHKSTKAYFFYNSKLISTHISYVGGKQVDEMIEKTYQLASREARDYKHQNAFVLTESQYSDVDDNQKEFARIMEQVFYPLITDFRRWELGFRVSHGLKISQLFVSGGTCNIRNMTNFLTEKLEIRTSLLETFEGVNIDKLNLTPKEKNSFTLANMMCLGLRSKQRLINLLIGKYSQNSSAELPIHSLVYVAVRSSAVALLMIVALLAEGLITQNKIKNVNNQIASLAKSSILQLTAKEKRLITSNPKALLDSLTKKQRQVKQQINTLQATADIRALSPLVTLSAQVTGLEVTMLDFTSSESGEVTAKFTALKLDELKKLNNKLTTSGLKDLQVSINEKDLNLELTCNE